MTVKDLTNINRTSSFELITIPIGVLPYTTYKIKTTSYFYYGYGAALNEAYNFRFSIVSGGITSIITKQGTLTNINPTITLQIPPDPTYPSGAIDICKFTGTNGSNPLGLKQEKDLIYSIFSQERISPSPGPVTNFTITNNANFANKRGDLQDLTQSALGTYEIVVKITDAGGLDAVYLPPIEVEFTA